MSFLDFETGTLCFDAPSEMRLSAGMSLAQLPQDCLFHHEESLVLPAYAVRGGSLSAVCELDEGKLRCVTLHVATVGGKPHVSSGRARAFLLTLLHLSDPCPDTRHSVRVRCAFGCITLCADPHTGQPSVHISYTTKVH